MVKDFPQGAERKSLEGSKTVGFKMADTSINVPSGFGGLLRYNEEFESKFMIKPMHVIVFIVLLIGFRIALGLLL